MVNKKNANRKSSSCLSFGDSEKKESKEWSEKVKGKPRSNGNLSNKSRESHNEKERKRRSRMKHSCEMLRMLIPGLTEKTDKATVLEYTVRYLLSIQQKSTE